MTLTNPARAGQLVDFTNQSEAVLTVASTPVDLSNSLHRLDQLDVSYDNGKTLTFTEATSIGAPTWSIDDDVTLQMDLDGSLKTYFRGKIRKRKRVGRNNQEAIQYTVFGIQRLASEITMTDAIDLPLVTWTAGTDITTVGTTAIYGQSISGALTYCFSTNATDLGSIGVTTSIGTPGHDAILGVLDGEVALQNMNFLAAIQQLVSYAPNYRVFFDDLQNAWVFPDILDQPVAEIELADDNLVMFEYEEDVSNRYTAIELTAPWEGVYVIPYKGYALLTPMWDTDLEDDWCYQKIGLANPQNPNGNYSWVYRRWTIPDLVEEANKHAPMQVVVRALRENSNNYIPIDARIDLENRVAVAECPIVMEGNPYDPGHATGPLEAYITFYRTDTAPTGGWQSLRVPTSGFEGTAYTLHGLERTKKEVVDLMDLNEYYAQTRLDVMKDVIITGDPIIEGDPIPELINLQKKVRATHASKTTGLESVAAVYTGYTYQFGRRGENQLQLTTDLANLLRIN